jgi:hypothetical protein
MPMNEKGQITVGKGKGIGAKRVDILWIRKVPSSHFSKFKRPYGWGKYKRKKGEKECTKGS